MTCFHKPFVSLRLVFDLTAGSLCSSKAHMDIFQMTHNLYRSVFVQHSPLIFSREHLLLIFPGRRVTSRSSVGRSSSTAALPCLPWLVSSGRSSACCPGWATRRQRTCSRPSQMPRGSRYSRSSSLWASSTCRARSTTSSRAESPETSGSTPSSSPRTGSTRSGRFRSLSTDVWPCGQRRQSWCSSFSFRTSHLSSSPTSGRCNSTKSRRHCLHQKISRLFPHGLLFFFSGRCWVWW